MTGATNSVMQSILIVEDHDDARREMCRIVALAFGAPDVCDVATLSQARVQLGARSFDLVVLDLGLPDGRGEDFILEIGRHQPNAYIVVSTIHDESDRLLAALQNGAKGYLLKEQPPKNLIAEFQGIQTGKPPLAPVVTRRILEHLRERDRTAAEKLVDKPVLEAAYDDPTGTSEIVSTLTARESEVLVLLAKGFNRPEIAGLLGISKHTVATHVEKIYGKLAISTRSEAAVIAQQNNLL